jgi:hypothetical protein
MRRTAGARLCPRGRFGPEAAAGGGSLASGGERGARCRSRSGGARHRCRGRVPGPQRSKPTHGAPRAMPWPLAVRASGPGPERGGLQTRPAGALSRASAGGDMTLGGRCEHPARHRLSPGREPDRLRSSGPPPPLGPAGSGPRRDGAAPHLRRLASAPLAGGMTVLKVLVQADVKSTRMGIGPAAAPDRPCMEPRLVGLPVVFPTGGALAQASNHPAAEGSAGYQVEGRAPTPSCRSAAVADGAAATPSDTQAAALDWLSRLTIA